MPQRRVQRAAVALLSVTALVTLTGPAAFAGGPVKLGVSKQADGPFDSHAVATMDVGDAKNFYLKARNLTQNPFLAELDDQQTPTNSSYTRKYFRNSDNITADVTGSGYQFNLKPGHPKFFRVKVKRVDANTALFCLFGSLVTDGSGFGIIIVVHGQSGDC